MILPSHMRVTNWFEHRSNFLRQEFTSTGTSAWTVNGRPNDYMASTITPVEASIKGLPVTMGQEMVGATCELWNSTKTTYKGLVFIQTVSVGTFTVVKSLGNSRSATNTVGDVVAGDYFVVVSSAHPGTGTAPAGNTDELEVVYNSCERTLTTLELDGDLLRNTSLRGGSSELERIRFEKLKEHHMKGSRKLLFSARAGGTGMADLAGDNTSAWLDSHGAVVTTATGAHIKDVNSNTVRTTMGIIPCIYRYGISSGDQQNIFTIAGASYKYDNFVDDMEKPFQYTPEGGELIAYCGSGALGYWSKVSADSGFIKKSGFSVQLESTERSELGFNFRRLITPHGNLLLVREPALRGPYRNTMLVVDDNNLQIKQYEQDKFAANIKTDDGYDGEKDEYTSDFGLAITLIEKHSVWNIV